MSNPLITDESVTVTVAFATFAGMPPDDTPYIGVVWNVDIPCPPLAGGWESHRPISNYGCPPSTFTLLPPEGVPVDSFKEGDVLIIQRSGAWVWDSKAQAYRHKGGYEDEDGTAHRHVARSEEASA